MDKLPRFVYLATACAIFISGCATSPSAGEQVLSPTVQVSFPTNDSGETYGSAWGLTPDEEPDLIWVEATNGREGYVRRTELHAADGSQVRNPDEAVAYMHRRNDASARGCFDALRDDLPGVPGSDWQATEDSRLLIEEIMASEVRGDLSTEGVAALASLLKEVGVTHIPTDLSRLAQVCATSARDARVQMIPVYKSDGVTVIGEFEIG